MTGPPIDTIQPRRILQQRFSFAGSPELAQDHRFQIPRPKIVRVEAQRATQMLERDGPIPSNAINLSQYMITGASPGLVPRRFVKCVVSLIITFEAAQAKAQVVVGFAIVRICIAPRQALDG